MRHEELVHEEEREGFTIKLYFAPEDMDPRDSFDEEIEAQFDTFGKIERGELLWFVAHVTAESPEGFQGDDYLGGCCYESVADFLKTSDYYDDMVGEAIRHAQEAQRKDYMRRCFA